MATAVVSEPPRPRVVTSLPGDTPWKPATMTTRPRASSSRTRTGRTSRMRAEVWLPVVMIPDWLPVKLTAGTPMSLSAMERSAMAMRSPAESSMSISRRAGAGETCLAKAMSWSVVLPMAETTTHTSWPARRAAATFSATCRILSTSATEEPPYFWTTVAMASGPDLRNWGAYTSAPHGLGNGAPVHASLTSAGPRLSWRAPGHPPNVPWRQGNSRRPEVVAGPTGGSHDRSEPPHQALPRPGGGGRPLLHGGEGRGGRLPGPERRRQVHHHAHPHRLPARHLGHGQGGGVRRLRGAAGGEAPRRLPPRTAPGLRRPHTPLLPALLRLAERAAPPASEGRDRPRRRAHRRHRGHEPGHRQPLQGLPAAGGPGPGAAGRPGGAGARRAHRGARPAPDPRGARAGEVAGRPAHRHPLHPYPPGGGHDLPEGAGHPPGAPGGLRHGGGAHRSPPAGPPRHPGRHRLPRGDLRQARHRPAGGGAGRAGSRLMRPVLAIARKELESYFTTPIARGMLTVVAFLAAMFFNGSLDAYRFVTLRAFQFQDPSLLERLNLTDMVVSRLLSTMAIFVVIVAPVLSGRLLAEEKRSRTFELLMTSPLRPVQIVLGKYLAALSVMAAAVAIVAAFPLVLTVASRGAGGGAGVEWQTVGTGLLGLFLFGAAAMSVGLLFSALTESVTVASLTSFLVPFTLWIATIFTVGVEGPVKDLVTALSASEHLNAFLAGRIELRDLVYYLSLTALGLYLAERTGEGHRWA